MNKIEIKDTKVNNNINLIKAIKNNKSENIIKLLLDKRVNVNQKDINAKYPLIYSLMYNNSENIIKLYR